MFDLREWLRPPRRMLLGYAGCALAGAALSALHIVDVRWMAVVLVAAGLAFLYAAIRKQLELNRLNSDFIYAISHELRTPLTSMRQLTESLVTGRVPSEERRREYYSVLHRESETLVRLVERLLDFGRVEAGVIEYRFEHLDIVALVGDVVEDFRARAGENGYSVELQANVDACTVHADRDAISRSLWNLLDNAMKHSPECKTIWVETVRRPKGVDIRVRDRGVGIRREDQKKIFNFFVRGESANRIAAKGTGIGLAIVDILVQAHGGKVTVESAPGKGSTFTIALPAED